ncbi:unnamed protein product [Darwinula stevensoni]|uniref:Timeless C-terminal domain-containing protein n=1 Tax=Darwinula stevensoni TaxID=69355 RepID=A0A7R9A3K3_9CRUS|nr:unnamed protein product [Darwinula stevensoni]CAG0882334.1 unnamed protein product [Darwinula stevensoni]
MICPLKQNQHVSISYLHNADMFATSKVVMAYSLLLREYAVLSPGTIMCILKMMHRLAVTLDDPAFFFQASLFRTFQKILSDPVVEINPALLEVKRFIAFIMRKFIEEAKKNSKLYMELLFWKTLRDVQEIQHGYVPYTSRSQAMESVWTEEQEDEVRRLYDEYQKNPCPGKSVVDFIHENLINRCRTRRRIMKKMRELELPYAVVQGKKRPPKEWSQEELQELKGLFEQHKNEPDALTKIQESMTWKRGRGVIKKTLLELGLSLPRTRDPTKTRKKKRNLDVAREDLPESRKPNEEDEDLPSFSSSTESSGDEDEARAWMRRGLGSKTKKEKKETHKRGVLSHPPIRPKDELVKEGRKLKTNPLLESAMRWILEKLEEEAEDEHEDVDEATPLVPITEEQESAMERREFLDYLTALGFTAPFEEQENFWRIPKHLPLVTSAISSLTHALEESNGDLDAGGVSKVVSLNNGMEVEGEDSDEELLTGGGMEERSKKRMILQESSDEGERISNKQPHLKSASDSDDSGEVLRAEWRSSSDGKNQEEERSDYENDGADEVETGRVKGKRRILTTNSSDSEEEVNKKPSMESLASHRDGGGTLRAARRLESSSDEDENQNKEGGDEDDNGNETETRRVRGRKRILTDSSDEEDKNDRVSKHMRRPDFDLGDRLQPRVVDDDDEDF